MKRLKKVKRRSSDKVFYSVVTVFLALLGLVVLYPLIYVVSCSFSSAESVMSGDVILFPTDFSLEGYKAVFRTNVVFEDFLKQFGWRPITFAIEIKQRGIEREIADMIRKYDVGKKCVVTSFKFDCIEKIRAYAPELKIGWLKKEISEADEESLKAIGGEEICPFAPMLTPEKVERWHRMGFNVRAWGVGNEEVMKNVYDCMTDGMTVNFPDKLVEYMSEKQAE